MTTVIKLSTAARRKIEHLLEEAKQFGSAYSKWKDEHKAALCAALAARLYDLVHEMRALYGVSMDMIARWGARKHVQQLKQQYLAA